MSGKSSAMQRAQEFLHPGETIETVLVGQVKQSFTQTLGRDVAHSLLTLGMESQRTVAPAVWIIPTNWRLLLLEKLPYLGRSVGELVFAAPRERLRFHQIPGALATVALTFADGTPVLTFNCGIRRGLAQAMVALNRQVGYPGHPQQVAAPTPTYPPQPPAPPAWPQHPHVAPPPPPAPHAWPQHVPPPYARPPHLPPQPR